MKRSLVARSMVDFAPHLLGCRDYPAFGADCEGAVYVAAMRSMEPLTYEQGAVFPKSRLDEPTSYVVLRWADRSLRRLEVPREFVSVGHVQPFPGGVLLVGARCCWRPEGAEKNGVAYDWDGRELVRLTLGDGIADVRTTPSGKIWVSYFDEGVYGNFGWGGPGPPPIGRNGLLCFTPTGEVAFRFDQEASGAGGIDDLYAMNVRGDDDVWAYYYSDFPLVHIGRHGYRAWPLALGGASAIAVDERRCLLLRATPKETSARVVQLGERGEFTVGDLRQLVDEHGLPLVGVRVVGVGKSVYFLRDAELLSISAW